MGSTNKYAYGLNQWVEADKPVMGDFNEDNRILSEDAMWKEEYDAGGEVAAAGGILSAVGGAIASVGGFALYEHTKNGTSHILENVTRGENIKFTATAAFTLGDTFLIGDVPFTPLMINGESPPTSFFASGATVIAFRHATNLYFPYSAVILSDSVSSASRAEAASSAAVKAVYDSAMPKAGGIFTGPVTADGADGSEVRVMNGQVQTPAGVPAATSWLRFRR